MRLPGVGREPALPPHPGQVLPVEDLEPETEPLLHFALPLFKHRRRGRDDDGADLLAEQQLASDQAGLDGLAQPGVVGNEQVDPGELQRLAQRFHLVRIDADAGPEGGLE